MARGYARGMEKRAGEACGWGLFGLTGLVGDALRALLLPDDPLAWAVTRQPPPAGDGLPWLAGSLPGLKVGRIDPKAETAAYIDKAMATRGKGLDDAGRALRRKAASVPGCVLDASQCSVKEVLALTREVQTLRDRLQQAIGS